MQLSIPKLAGKAVGKKSFCRPTLIGFLWKKIVHEKDTLGT
jgi:hypothetical protein